IVALAFTIVAPTKTGRLPTASASRLCGKNKFPTHLQAIIISFKPVFVLSFKSEAVAPWHNIITATLCPSVEILCTEVPVAATVTVNSVDDRPQLPAPVFENSPTFQMACRQLEVVAEQIEINKG